MNGYKILFFLFLFSLGVVCSQEPEMATVEEKELIQIDCSFLETNQVKELGDFLKSGFQKKLDSLEVSFDFQELPLVEAFDQLEKISGLTLLFPEEALNRTKEEPKGVRVSLKVDKVSILDALNLLIKTHNLGLEVEVEEDYINMVSISALSEKKNKPKNVPWELRTYSLSKSSFKEWIEKELTLKKSPRQMFSNRHFELLASPRVTVFDHQPFSVSILNQYSYISRFQVLIQDGKTIVDPLIEVLSEGMILDDWVTFPSGEGKGELELKINFSELQKPVPEVETFLGSVSLPQVISLEILVKSKVDLGTVLLVGPIGKYKTKGNPEIKTWIIVGIEKFSKEVETK